MILEIWVFLLKCVSWIWKLQLQLWNANHESRVVKSNPSSFPIRSTYVFYFTFSLACKFSVMLVAFLLFLSNLYIVLARGKGPKKVFIEIFSRQVTLNKKFAKPSKTFSSQNFYLIPCKVILMPQKMLNKTSNLKMAVCKAASRGCNQNPWRTPVNYLIFCKAVNS